MGVCAPANARDRKRIAADRPYRAPAAIVASTGRGHPAKSSPMREKELRLALVCYGGISLAVYMHGITKEIWRLVRASQAFHGGGVTGAGSQGVYHRLFESIAAETGLSLRILTDILAGASAGGINCIFLAQAISTGQSLEPLTDLWLDHADIDALADRDEIAVRRFMKNAAVPFAW